MTNTPTASNPNPTPTPISITPVTATSTTPTPVTFKEQKVSLSNGKQLTLKLPSQYTLSVAAQGYRKLRFMDKSPDGRLFVGEMRDAGDSTTGRVLIFSDLDQNTGTFKNSSVYLTNLRNPHSLTFYQDKDDQTWLYIALTDKLIRYKYSAGDLKPQGSPQTIATFPAYGPSAQNGGWHLTRTVVTHNDKVYVSVGSSCNSCEEKLDEPSRASIVVMDPDGKNFRVFANGLRNAVGLAFVGDQLYASVNGSDHLGPDKPEDTFIQVKDGTNYGWPWCYQVKGQVYTDTSKSWQRSIDCSQVPLAEFGFDPHSAPLGIATFDGSVLAALHGSGQRSLGIGYKVTALHNNNGTWSGEDLITGFLQDGVAHGRPAGILANDDQSFFVTDDYNGALYLVTKK